MKSPKFIGLVGKDEAENERIADLISEISRSVYVKRKMSMSIKAITSILTGASIREQYSRSNSAKVPDGFVHSLEKLSQIVETHLKLVLDDPDVWVKSFFNNIKGSELDASYIISDVKLPNEIKAVQERGGIVIGIDGGDHDYTISTEGSLFDQYQSIIEIFRQIGFYAEK